MKANELRIGNFTKQGELKSFFENGIHVGFGKCYNFNELKPIPLTEEWLFKICRNKFSVKDGWEVEIQGEIFEFFVNDLDDTFFMKYTGGEGVSFGKEIKYVHQLQNLYFALTGDELKIKSN
jgi:hypothetical protein